MNFRNRALWALAASALIAGCAKTGDLVVDQGVGISAVLTACPAVGIPDFTGDITQFAPVGDRTAGNIDVTAAITNLRSTCNETGERVYTAAESDVVHRTSRSEAGFWGR